MSETFPIKVGPVTVNVISEGDRIVLGIQTKKPFEPESLETWALMCGSAEGGAVIDIGAYTGLFTIGARLLGCHVLPFEPLPANRARLKQNCRINGVSDQVNSEAVADRMGSSSIQSTNIPYTSGASLIRKTGRSWPVELLTIDSLKLWEAKTTLKAMKIDVERAEPMVLRGARETLERCRPEILIEVLGGDEGQRVLEAMDGLGYKHAATLDTRNWLMVPG